MVYNYIIPGGARITHANYVAVYIRNGAKYYSYTDKVPVGVTVIEIYANPLIAAKEGFTYDPININ